VRLHRIELLTAGSSADTAVDLPFHHQSTVIAGLGRLEREALTTEVIAALGTGRAGLSADLSTQNGQRLAIRRPLADDPRIFDVDTDIEVTDQFMVNGVLDPLRALELPTLFRVTRSDLVAAEASNDRVQRLAALDQDQLWGLAISLAELEVEIARQTDDEVVHEAISSEASEQIEQARADVDIAKQQLEEKSNQSVVAAASLALISFVVALITHPLIAIPFLMTAIAVAYRSWTWHKEHEAALATEQHLLEHFGLESYLDFQLRKVDALTNNTQQRRATLTLAEKRRFAHEQWRQFVGPDVSLEWAATHRPTISAASNQAPVTMFSADAAADATSLALADRIREATACSESSPLIIDEIFSGQSDEVVEHLLWLVDHHCQQLQFILMSSDPRVLTWGAERASARQASVIRLAEDNASDNASLPEDAVVSLEPTSDQAQDLTVRN
jgi:hypothetical protein